ncbi:hypothetical protein RvY_09447 [Ramazzottius varieornatus]|uniref:BSD domain-containing protein n=1 Tax=Ramazzottius varieornatus TaxID=947166 RepID=A0A1D1VBK8_RAMVA|nr:hypothetical protein RvY_09447 [Ramazzottius varieornatus]
MDKCSPDAAEVYLEPAKKSETIADATSTSQATELSKGAETASGIFSSVKSQIPAGLFGGISDLASRITAASQTVVDHAKEVGKTVQKSIEEKTVLGDFNKMQQEFIQEKQAQFQGPGSAPWEESANGDEVKRQVVALSTEKRNFTREPPAGANFEFDLASAMPVIPILMKEDPNLDKLRFELVPKVVSENSFWRNYFYRISLIKQSSALTTDNLTLNKPITEADRDDISIASNLDLMDGSVVGDSDAHPEEHHPVDIPSCSPSASSSATSGTKGAKKPEDWEQELQNTLDSYEVVNDVDVNDIDLERELISEPVPAPQPTKP